MKPKYATIDHHNNEHQQLLYVYMKGIRLTEYELETLETALIEYDAVVTFDQLSSLFNEDRQFAFSNMLKSPKFILFKLLAFIAA